VDEFVERGEKRAELFGGQLAQGRQRQLQQGHLLAGLELAERGGEGGERRGGSGAGVLGDERLLRRAVRNLIDNAQRYGGGAIDIVLATAAGDVEVRVCDRGPGVPEDLRERIFEAFYRLPGHAETAGGVGLGLSLVKQIAERHSGRVRCEPREGGGSCFVLSLPAGMGAGG
jgi:hypothetical protein